MGCPPVLGDNPQSFSERIILRTAGHTKYNYFTPPTSVLDLAHHVVFRYKVGKGGIIETNADSRATV